jgi:hypothetical protein
LIAPLTLLQFAVKLLAVTFVEFCAFGAAGVQGNVFVFLTLELLLVAHPL